METTQQGINLIKSFEGCKLLAYKIPGEKRWTIGYGHSGADVEQGMVITKERAEELLRHDLVKFEKYVEKYVTDIELTPCRNDALVSYCYNRGPSGLKELASHCHTVEEYSDGFTRYWGKSERYKKGLLRRREAERYLFDQDTPKKSIEEIAREVIAGEWGSGTARKRRLYQAGYDPYAVQAKVNKILKGA